MPAPPAGVSFVLFLAPCKFFSKKRGDLCAPRWRSGGLRAPSLPGRGRPRLAHGPRPNRRLEASSTVPANWVQEKLKDIACFRLTQCPLFSKRALAPVLRKNLPRKRGFHQLVVASRGPGRGLPAPSFGDSAEGSDPPVGHSHHAASLGDCGDHVPGSHVRAARPTSVFCPDSAGLFTPLGLVFDEARHYK